MQEIKGRIHSVESFGALDGPGIRYVLFLQGCPLRCVYCHNPDTWELDGKNVKTPDEVIADIVRYKNFIKKGGVTISGGEPLMQADFCRALIDLCRKEGLHTAIDTSGGVPLSSCRQAVDAADMLLLDIKALDGSLCEKLTGRDSKNALELLSYCEITGKPVWIRHVLVPGMTLVKERLTALADFLTAYSCIKKIELLPFHKMGEYKWETMGLRSPLSDTEAPAESDVAMAKQIFIDRGFLL